MEQCPFCWNTVAEGAVVCTSCYAEKGYVRAEGNVLGRTGTISFGVVLPGVIALFFVWLWAAYSGPGEKWPLYVTIVFLIPVLFSVWRLTTGPVWYRFKDCQ